MSELLRLEDVHVAYRRGHRRVEVLRGVSLDVALGEITGVWADRSAGKTTLAKVAAGLIAPDAGTVTLDGESLAEHDRGGRLHRRVGFASRRNPGPEHATIVECVAATLLATTSWKAAEVAAYDALDRVGVGDLGRDRWDDLPDGERVRVGLAHAIARRPCLLVVDDPVAGMGGGRRSAILKLLHALVADGMAVLMTAAELSELSGASHIVQLDDGKIEADTRRAITRRTSATVVPFRAAGGG